ncbi:2,3-bisphosphoglycerate-independent phosphoglycerate mutase [Caldicoprobacter guelmensis]|uniref:2,3-bisphosphoglycerate-independent phosphoglycerate mutase n=1 Tax=Caldicoprobacter guelmensis TaxID=1170224 RepID=UPI00195E8297|nr:2,3-bisphosphoglycerate-independent phosphoglycerate mutase [Caldicoprobacter guelmensis]MBM7582682.1 2,3-bisphosphoglycerate-independent phosphoglycerate mutase [Caldicoprobacter guelmensis]
MQKDLTVLIIMDGFGLSDRKEGNAVYQARTPNLDRYWNEYPHVAIGASGLDVGLPAGQMGNSEVGHLNIGAGRIVYQELTRISKAIEDGSFFNNRALLTAIENVKKHGTKLHLMGLVSDGGVHSHIEHLYALVELAKKSGLPQVYIHCFTDGRDVPPTSGKSYIEALERKLDEYKFGKIATVMGRYYAMDRDKRWDRTQKAYDALVLGIGEFASSGVEAMEQSYRADVTDEFVRPTVVLENGKPVTTIGPNDSIIFFNFRPDRARQLTRAFIQPEFNEFPRAKGYFPVCFVSMTQYDETFTNIHVAYEPQVLTNTFGEYISKLGKKQLRIAETEKYAHVTFFFNGGVEYPNENEDRVLIPSPKVATYDLKPSMSAFEVTDEVERRIASGEYDVIILNYANCDMVGHTGVMEAAIEAVETVDKCVGRVVEAVRARGGKVIVTADHGNAEQMIDYETGEPHTAHTSNPVPFILIDDTRKDVTLREGGRLADIIPTMLELMGIEKPKEMTGESLILKK